MSSPPKHGDTIVRAVAARLYVSGGHPLRCVLDIDPTRQAGVSAEAWVEDFPDSG